MSKNSTRNPIIETREDFDSYIEEAARIELEIQQLETNRDTKIDKLKEDCDRKVSPLKMEHNNLIAHIQIYALKNKVQLVPKYPKRKTFKHAFADIKFQSSPGKISLQNGITEAVVIERLKENKLDQYITTKEGIDKVALKGLEESTLNKLGLYIDDQESINFKPKAESLQK